MTTARGVLGDEKLTAVMPFLQEAAMPPRLQNALEDIDIELDDVRKRMGATLGVGEQDLIRLRRVTKGSILNLALLVFAAYALIGLLGDVDHGRVRRRPPRGELVVARLRLGPRPDPAHSVAR